MKVALVHDWLTGMRGGERVLEALAEMFPDAPIYTLLHVPGEVSAGLERHRIHSSVLGRLPYAQHWFRAALPAFFAFARSLDLRGYDLVISSSHCVAKAVCVPPGTCHLAYLHTPMRYIWDQYDSYLPPDRTPWWLRALAAPLRRYLQAQDRASNQGITSFAANSHFVAARIARYYGRDATVIPPPVRTFPLPTDRLIDQPIDHQIDQQTDQQSDLPLRIASEFAPSGAEVPVDRTSSNAPPYYLAMGALVPYKRVDLAVAACTLLGRRLVVIGGGPEARRLRRMAGPTIEFVGWQSEAQVARALAGCRALLFPGEEDFGITPLEAMACGRPVLALGRGGALETVVDAHGHGFAQGTGLFFESPTMASLVETIQRFESLEAQFDPRVLRAHAAGFGEARFKAEVSSWIAREFEAFQRAQP